MPVIGTQQSPIKIDSAMALHVSFGNGHLAFHYRRPLHGKIDSANHNFVFDPPAKDDNPDDWSITIAGSPWLIRQIHMHAPAEHLVDSDEPKPFEVHLVHSTPNDPDAKGDKVVVGVFIAPGKETREKKSLERFIDRVSKRKSGAPEPTDANPFDFLPDSGLGDFFRYEGSLTGGPYSEDISWFVMKEVGVVDKAKFDVLADYAEHHAREVQQRNRRFVLRSF